ncbi:MAG TPA: hypothetical protein VHN82_03260 [Methanoregula sp.]|nr:hypothetical protein [Methanoregula sp.]
MKVRQMIDAVLTESKELGMFGYPEILRAAGDKGFFGLAVAHEENALGCLVFVRGEPGGAIFSDENGDLFGDNAVILVTRMERFVLSAVQPDIAEALVMGCRVFDTTRLRQGLTEAIPEIGVKSEGVGRLTVIVLRGKEPLKGIRLSIRKEGRILGSDFTDSAGSAGFRLMHGDYECIVQEKSRQIRSFAIHFRENEQRILIEL